MLGVADVADCALNLEAAASALTEV